MALSELRISAVPYWTNTFGARGLEEDLNFFFLAMFFLWFGRTKADSRVEGRKELDGARTLSELRISALPHIAGARKIPEGGHVVKTRPELKF